MRNTKLTYFTWICVQRTFLGIHNHITEENLFCSPPNSSHKPTSETSSSIYLVSPLNDMDNIIEAVIVIAFLMLLFVVLMCCLAESRKRFTTERFEICCNWRSHINTESTITHTSESGRPERTSGNQVVTRVTEIYSTTHQETPSDPANYSRIPQNILTVSVLPEIILTPSQQVINLECDSPQSYESLFRCECSDSPSPNSGV